MTSQNTQLISLHLPIVLSTSRPSNFSSSFMANQSNQLLLPNSSPQNFFESFLEAYKEKLYDISCANSSPEKRSQLRFESDRKMKEFELKYPVPETLKFVQQYLDVAREFAISSEPSSSFQLVCNIMYQMAAKYGRSLKEDVPEVWKMLISIMATYESSTNTQGSNLAALEILGGHGRQGKELSTTLANSSTFPNISSSSLNNLNHSPTPHHSIDIEDSQVSESPNIVTSINNETSAVINNTPFSPTASNEPTKLALATFASTVELVSTLSNFALNHSSSRAKEYQVLMYIVLSSSTIALLLSSTALLLHYKKPVAANKMQKVAFLFGAFGYMGIVGLLMPPTIMMWFTLSAFVVCFLIFTIATLM